ncbi:MAG: hypothetical protein ACTTJZ_02955 [Sphaerochaetaceae bacterium]
MSKERSILSIPINTTALTSVYEKTEEGNHRQKNCEIDFIARKGSRIYYNETGILRINLLDFLLDEGSLDR